MVARVKHDPEFAKALLDEAATLFLNGEPETAKFIWRDLVNATMGFEQLAQSVAKPSKSMHRMLSSAGNPAMTNLAANFAALKTALKVDIRAHTGRWLKGEPTKKAMLLPKGLNMAFDLFCPNQQK